jgi:hypothetical protein
MGSLYTTLHRVIVTIVVVVGMTSDIRSEMIY